MRPEDERLLASLPPQRREGVKTALETLQRLREEYPGARDDDLPPDVRERGIAAAMVVRRATTSPVHFPVALIGLLLLAIGIGLAFFQPVTFYAFRTSGEGIVRGLIRERPLALFPWRVQQLTRVMSATGESRQESYQSTDSDGHRRSGKKTVETVWLGDPAGRTVYEQRLEYVLGADLSEMARRVEALARGREPASLVRWAAVWPVHLLTTLAVFIGFAMLWSAFTGLLFWLSFSPFGRISTRLVTNTVLTLLFAALLATWGILIAGGNPPAWLVAALRAGP